MYIDIGALDRENYDADSMEQTIVAVINKTIEDGQLGDVSTGGLEIIETPYMGKKALLWLVLLPGYELPISPGVYCASVCEGVSLIGR